jgi:hypothetical protein
MQATAAPPIEEKVGDNLRKVIMLDITTPIDEESREVEQKYGNRKKRGPFLFYISSTLLQLPGTLGFLHFVPQSPIRNHCTWNFPLLSGSL